MIFSGGGGNLPEMLSGLWRMGTYREHCSLIAVRNLSRMFLDIKSLLSHKFSHSKICEETAG